MTYRKVGAPLTSLLFALTLGCGADPGVGYGSDDDDDDEPKTGASTRDAGRDAGKDAGSSTLRDASTDAGWDDEANDDDADEDTEDEAADDDDDVAAACAENTAATFQLLKSRCSSCHGNGAAQGGFGGILNAETLVSSGRVKRNDAANSAIYKRVEAGSMPLGGPPLSRSEVATIEAWIECGAPSLASDAGTATGDAGRDAGVRDAGVRDAGVSDAGRDAGRTR